MSGLIPQAFLDSLLERTDIVELIDGYLPLRKQGASFVACCPFHHEKSPSFNVIPKKQFYHCFGCGASGNAIGFIMQHVHVGFPEAVELLASRLGLEVPREASSSLQVKKTRPDLYGLLSQVSQFYHQQLKQNAEAQAYIQQRGLNEEVIVLFQLGYAPSAWHTLAHQFKGTDKDLIVTGMLIQKEDSQQTYDRYRHRLIFPIHDRQGRVVGFGGRALESDQKPKYLNSPETPLFHKSRELYGLYQVLTTCQEKEIEQILVVEGYMDVIALTQHGIKFAVATLGTATTPSHLQLLNKYTKHIVFCFDGDEAGRKAAWRALENSLSMLNAGLALSFAFLPDSHDPDSYVREFGQEKFLTLMAHAIPLNQFFLDTLAAKVPLQTVSGKSQLIQLSLPYLQQVPDGAYKTLLMDALSRLTRIDRDRIQHFMTGQAAPLAKTSSQVITRSPLRLAIALLLQYPERFVNHLPDIALSVDEEPGIEVLQGLLVSLKAMKHPTTAILVEQWRETSWFDAIQKLSCWDHQVPEVCIEQEFNDLIVFLNKQNVEKQVELYLTKSRSSGLTVEERTQLQQLLKMRHQLA